MPFLLFSVPFVRSGWSTTVMEAPKAWSVERECEWECDHKRSRLLVFTVAVALAVALAVSVQWVKVSDPHLAARKV